MTKQVHAFLLALRRVPIAAWSRCGDAIPGTDPTDDPLAPTAAATDDRPRVRTAWIRLRTALAGMPEVEVRIRRRVDEELAPCEGIAPRAACARMRAAAYLAAAALATRHLLSPADFQTLYAPFGSLIPMPHGEVH
jgi:hypothetical protein